ncbi:MAG: AAA family ATPase [Desulfotignum sp.]|nr:AAA family ATPase [Desulfotignum sp.]
MNKAIQAAMAGKTPDAGGEVRTDCPNCEGGQRDTLGVNVSTGAFHCFRCDLRGNLKENSTDHKPLAQFLHDQAQQVSTHPYVQAKQIRPPEIRQDQYGNWVAPFFDQAGQLQTIQFIDPEGKKRFLSKTKNNGVGFKEAAYIIQGRTDTIVWCEGIATGWSIHHATGATVLCCGSKDNLNPVMAWSVGRYPDSRKIVAGDNDKSGDGQRVGAAAARKHNTLFAVPGIPGTDFNDMAIDAGPEAVKKVLENAKMPDPDQEAPSQWDEPMDMRLVIYKKPDTISWLIFERLPLARAIIITGLGGSSKTRLLYILSIGVALRFLPWSWEVEKTGKALLVLTEDTAQDVHRTVYYIARDLTDDQKQTLSENLIIYPLAGKDTRLMIKTSHGTVEKSPLFFSLQQKIIALGHVSFVGLDPALSVSEGDEMDQSHQRALGKMADDLAVTTGATVALVSHATKGSLSKLELTSHNSRGGGAITDAVRAEYSLRNMTTEEASQAGITDVEERKRLVQLIATKGNALPPSAFVPVWLRRDDFGNLAEADIQMDGKGTLTDRDMEVLKVHSRIGVFGTPKLADWRAECIKVGLITGANENAQKQAMKRVVDKLLKAELIAKGIGRGIYTQTGETTEPPF